MSGNGPVEAPADSTPNGTGAEYGLYFLTAIPNVISRSKVVIFFALFLFVGDSGMVTAQDEPVCDSWQLQGFWIGMPKQEALTLHAVKKTLNPGSIAWKSMLQEHTGAQRLKSPR